MTRRLERSTKKTAGDAVEDEEADCTDEEKGITSENEMCDCNIPARFVCPLTLEVFTDPLMSRRGLTFERKAITEWLDRGNDTCPLTREPLGYRGLVPNVKLRLEVEAWKLEHGYKIKPCDAEEEMKRRQLCFVEVTSALLFYGHEGNRETVSPLPNFSGINRSRHASRRRRSQSRPDFNSTRHRRQRLISFIGEALNTIRRAPADDN